MPFIADILALLTLASTFVIIVFVIDSLLVHVRIKRSRFSFWDIFGEHALLFGFVVSLVAMLGSLYYSDILSYTPCKLCWYQRIAMYPQVFLFGIALWLKDRSFIWSYSRALSFIGALIALVHYYIQIAKTPVFTLPCAALGYSASCSETFTMSFGFITIPMMALASFVLLLILGLIRRYDHVV